MRSGVAHQEMYEERWTGLRKKPCRRCGTEVPIVDLLVGEHFCDPDEQVRFESAVLQAEIAAFLASGPGRRRVDFARWCREHGVA